MKPRYKIVRSHSVAGLVDLEKAVNAAIADGYEANGAPFYSTQTQEWCQSVTLTVPSVENEVRLREPAKKR